MSRPRFNPQEKINTICFWRQKYKALPVIKEVPFEEEDKIPAPPPNTPINKEEKTCKN